MLETLQQAIARVQGLTAYATYKDKLTNTFGVVVECDAPRDTTGTGTREWCEGQAHCVGACVMPGPPQGDMSVLQRKEPSQQILLPFPVLLI